MGRLYRRNVRIWGVLLAVMPCFYLTSCKAMDKAKRSVDASADIANLDHFNTQAIDLLTSERAVNAFDMSQEDDATRDRYGRHKWGQRALLARRLVEAGVSFVTMQMQNPRLPGGIGNWDIHAVNGHLFDDNRARLPVFDAAVAALVEDLYERGLDEKVMLIVSGTFTTVTKGLMV